MEYTPQFKENMKTQFLASEYERLEAKKAEVLADAASDPELQELADEEVKTLEEAQAGILETIKNILDEEKEEQSSPKKIIMEFRAGAGGDEAALFAQDLRDMYLRFAEIEGYSTKFIDDYTLEISGKGVYEDLKF